ncbi:unnamed protein product [Chondrus crispus]|uniref:Uncharacterized protein n=1 Tax=Chondrus crispus TaxID=2769 RepID=R7QMF3_CHOCR|nr:unnamed protein product [Chondrus crispus]CDF38555.1 unnamed protein product [Chondrus crispus]|eukprot:XP_005718448.1 unnamed protein product [Chondrus crispus]
MALVRHRAVPHPARPRQPLLCLPRLQQSQQPRQQLSLRLPSLDQQDVPPLLARARIRQPQHIRNTRSVPSPRARVACPSPETRPRPPLRPRPARSASGWTAAPRAARRRPRPGPPALRAAPRPRASGPPPPRPPTGSQAQTVLAQCDSLLSSSSRRRRTSLAAVEPIIRRSTAAAGAYVLSGIALLAVAWGARAVREQGGQRRQSVFVHGGGEREGVQTEWRGRRSRDGFRVSVRLRLRVRYEGEYECEYKDAMVSTRGMYFIWFSPVGQFFPKHQTAK